jgi:hypothetical protein
MVGIGSTAVIHGHAVEASRSKGFDIGRDLFQMPAERFLALI